MAESIAALSVLMICYFAIRINRVELRMNALEKALNQVAKNGELDTEVLGKPFGGDAGGLRDFFRAVKTTWKGSK